MEAALFHINIFLINGIVGLFLTVIMLYFSIIFMNENEKRASLITLALSLITIALFSFTSFYLNNEIIAYSFVFLIFILGIILVIPVKVKSKVIKNPVKFKFDERDVMFSRAALKPGSENFKEYYKNNSEKKILDDKFRAKAGLLSKKSLKYNEFKFASANANFEAVEVFVGNIEEVAKENVSKKEINAHEISNYIKNWIKQIGAVSIGITELKDYHLYSHKGRGKEYGKEITDKHPFAVAFTVEMDKTMIDKAPKAETVVESSQQYYRSAAIANQLTLFIRQFGYSAKPHFDGNYDLICPTVARDAGLGELGRMGILMSHEIGPRVRIAVVTTDLPLIADKINPKPSMTEFCKICKKCAVNCPVKAISFDNPKEEFGTERWTINQESCFTYWNVIGTDCGKCIQVCPYSHPNNFMHNLIRKGIDNSRLFAQAALKADDLFYGKNPKSK
ncbi:MAG: 4Fe-4S dicluster domain-containing protein [Bacteroidales bacterium]|nr:4Fe-4S dicluster domain-containing protein [Bacteroidales bacterium]